jgi:hypothetical protein
MLAWLEQQLQVLSSKQVQVPLLATQMLSDTFSHYRSLLKMRHKSLLEQLSEACLRLLLLFFELQPFL